MKKILTLLLITILRANAELPEKIQLKENTRFPIYISGNVSGFVNVTKGTYVALIKVESEVLTVRNNTLETKVPVEKTNFNELLELKKAQATVEQTNFREQEDVKIKNHQQKETDLKQTNINEVITQLKKRVRLLRNNYSFMPTEDKIVCEKIFQLTDPYFNQLNQGQMLSENDFNSLREKNANLLDSSNIKGTTAEWETQENEEINFGLLKNEVEWMWGKSLAFYLAFGPPALKKTCIISPIIWGQIREDIPKWRDWALQCYDEKLETEKEISYGPLKIGLKSLKNGINQYFFINYQPEGLNTRYIIFVNPLHFELLMRQIYNAGKLLKKEEELKKNAEKLK